jgi:transposase
VRVIREGRGMWTVENRRAYERKGLRYPSDLSDEEWSLVEPHLPPPRQRSRHPSPDRRLVLDAILYVLTTGCQWRALPKDFPPKSTVHGYFVDWHCDGTLTRIHHALYAEVRELVGKAPTPTTSIVDSQSVKGAEKGGLRTIRRAMTAPRSSKARSAISPSTRSA